MPNPGAFIKSFRAEAAIPGRRIVKFGAAGGIALAAAATDRAIGIADQLDATEGQMADVIMSGSAEVQLGATVAAGAPIAPDASGLGITAVAGAGNVAIGYALQSGDAGDIIDVALARHSVT
ncbi:hypothetical protein SAMN05443999_101249 [Roseovarius azorensis]|uniref:DUF2190 domain-containing protein n=1 Tax=Roseovarius azorensis TaxID=1287727 RepID=A0A1H7G9Q1_9RHOB|nr:capsid cement protein [Roseovarius azorensis]SEK34197.1 hypothetical protein SAMN05443999_101249 [Roseovarius azorensis]